MNILFITHFDGFYGSSNSLLGLIQGLKAYDVNPFVVVPAKSKFTDLLEENKIPYKLLNNLPWWVALKPISLLRIVKTSIRILQSIFFFNKYIDEWKIDCVITNSSVIASGRLVSILKKIPHIWFIREFGDLHFSLNFIFPNYLSKKLIESSDAIICNSKAIKDYYFKSDNKNAYVVYNGIALKEKFDLLFEQHDHKPKEEFYKFAIVGGISSAKGQAEAIRAVGRIINEGYKVKLIVAGSGKRDFINELHQLVQDLGINDAISFLGFVDDPYSVYSKADCLLMCSEYEAFGRVTAEAMSTGLPVIGKNSGGTPEVIVHEKTGLLYNTFDELVNAMIRIIENPEWGQRLGLEGWQQAKDRFNIEANADNVYQVIHSIIKNKGKRE